MSIVIVLMMVSIAISAYARGRREGTWSWPLFVKTLLALWAVCAVAGVFGVWLGRRMGPDHALLATILIVIVIAVGVLVLTLWVQKKSRLLKNARMKDTRKPESGVTTNKK
jgi:uncharacterized membrane protein YfcA